jgi:hypothetical protein
MARYELILTIIQTSFKPIVDIKLMKLTQQYSSTSFNISIDTNFLLKWAHITVQGREAHFDVFNPSQ